MARHGGAADRRVRAALRVVLHRAERRRPDCGRATSCTPARRSASMGAARAALAAKVRPLRAGDPRHRRRRRRGREQPVRGPAQLRHLRQPLRRPNARLELWPVLKFRRVRAAPAHGPRRVGADRGAEIRIDYESAVRRTGAARASPSRARAMGGARRAATRRRPAGRRRPRAAHRRLAAARRLGQRRLRGVERRADTAAADARRAPLPREGAAGGDRAAARARAAARRQPPASRSSARSSHQPVATHLPGRPAASAATAVGACPGGRPELK